MDYEEQLREVIGEVAPEKVIEILRGEIDYLFQDGITGDELDTIANKVQDLADDVADWADETRRHGLRRKDAQRIA